MSELLPCYILDSLAYPRCPALPRVMALVWAKVTGYLHYPARVRRQCNVII